MVSLPAGGWGTRVATERNESEVYSQFKTYRMLTFDILVN